MSLLRSAPASVALAVALLAVALFGQALSDANPPATAVTGTGYALGRASFAYLTGLRTFAAAVLWNRVDPVYHEYYGEGAVDRQRFMLPNMRLVTVLDPQFIQAYYVAQWIVVRNGRVDEALNISEDSVKNNPRSGLLRASFAQILMIYAHRPKEAVREADLALFHSDWANGFEQHDGYVVLRSVYRAAGRLDRVAYLQTSIDRLDRELDGVTPPEGSEESQAGERGHTDR
ncbi:MAG: hypothetical protein WC971_00905 [Coriobacteriia bacterium]